jgi:hypothetical protein
LSQNKCGGFGSGPDGCGAEASQTAAGSVHVILFQSLAQGTTAEMRPRRAILICHFSRLRGGGAGWIDMAHELL